MRTQEEIAGKYTMLVSAKNSKDVQVWLSTIKELVEDLNAQYMNEKGEEAVRAWGVIKGLNMALHLDGIWGASLPEKPKSNIFVPPPSKIIKA